MIKKKYSYLEKQCGGPPCILLRPCYRIYSVYAGTKPTDIETGDWFGDGHTNFSTETDQFAGFDRWLYIYRIRGRCLTECKRALNNIYYYLRRCQRDIFLLLAPTGTVASNAKYPDEGLRHFTLEFTLLYKRCIGNSELISVKHLAR